jgi:hypothetical protein
VAVGGENVWMDEVGPCFGDEIPRGFSNIASQAFWGYTIKKKLFRTLEI